MRALIETKRPISRSAVDIHRTKDKKVDKKRRSKWGLGTFAELIEKAILESPEKQLPVAEIYEAFKRYDSQFFADSSDEESKSWKNSIRHNLSLREKFVRLYTGGKSAWTLNYLLPQLERKQSIYNRNFNSLNRLHYNDFHNFNTDIENSHSEDSVYYISDNIAKNDDELFEVLLESRDITLNYMNMHSLD
ncbi:MAG: Forkhead box, partial [Paramarteilia canceri]